MANVKKLRPVGLFFLVTATSSCALTPEPEESPLIREMLAQESYYSAKSESIQSGVSLDWWSGIGGPELSDLVETLRRDSLILKETRLQAVQALEAARIARGQKLPSIIAIGDISTSRTPQLNGSFSWSESYSAGAILDFNTDVFGKLRASERAAKLNAAASDLVVQATEQREIAVLARNWVSAATLKRRLELAIRTAESFQATYELTNQRYAAGSETVSASDVQIALQNLETALVEIPQIETDLNQQLMIIDEQLARMPGETQKQFEGILPELDTFTAPVGRPASVLANRPDVAAAELRYLAALEDIGAARASLYPAISLTASLTFQGDTPADLLDWDRHIASLANSLTAPVFQGGRLKAQVRLEQAQADELANTFARNALGAVIDVELALTEIDGLETQRERLKAALKTARLSNELAQGRYRQGLISILAVLETQRSLNAAEQNLILTEQALLNAKIDLYLSLGGDWTAETATINSAGILDQDTGK